MTELICARCNSGRQVDDDGYDRGTIGEYQPYLAIGYADLLPLHEFCAEVDARTPQRCMLCRNRKTTAPLRLFVMDDGGIMVGHESCRIGGTEILPDGTVQYRCLICMRWSTQVAPYDIGDGVPTWLDPSCARKLGGRIAAESIQTGFARGLVLGATIEVVRNR